MIADCLAKTLVTPTFSDSWNKKAQTFFVQTFARTFYVSAVLLVT
jgi:hypothetical protein